MKKIWFSCNKFTALVVVNSEDIIIDAAPIVKIFVGQPLINLQKWAARFGDVKMETL